MLRTEGIVLSEMRFKETSKILNIYTKDFGKISVMARGAYRPKSQLIATTQPFSHNEYLLHKGRNFYYLNQGSVIEPFYDIRKKVERFLYGSYILELVDKSTPEAEENERIFLLLLKGLEVLSKLDEGFLKFTYAFGLKYISFLGYRPYIDKCVICNEIPFGKFKFSHIEGGIICRNCFDQDLNAKSMTSDMYKDMQEILYTPLDDLDKLDIKESNLKRLQNILEEYILYSIDRKSFNSLKLIRSIEYK